MKTVDISNDNRQLGPLGGKVMQFAAIVGIAGVVVSAVMAFIIEDGAAQFFKSYLLAFCFVVSIALGALFFAFLQHATRAGWSVTVRRIAEGFSANLIWIWVLFLPIFILVLIGQGDVLYKWMDPAVVDPDSDKYDSVVAHKEIYLNTGFFLVRNVIYFAAWALLGWYFLSRSVAQDETGDPELTSRMQARSYPAALLFAVTVTFASFDWIMSLAPHWFSTIFGVYFFAGCACAAFSVMILSMYFLQQSGRLRNAITVEHYHDMGKMLFAFGIVFWAYIAFSQYMLIWYANIPETTGWYIARQLGGWSWFSIFLLVGHFIGPFLILISRHPKRNPRLLAIGAAWMLFMHVIDLYYLIMPPKPEAEMAAAETYTELADSFADMGVGWHLMDLTTLVGLGGLFLAGTCYLMRDKSLLCEKDPRLSEALAFENM